MDIDEVPPEASLIERLREAQVPKLSVTRAAKAAGISEGRWRQIAKGYQQATKDTRLPVVAPADTLARMAVVVGASAEQLREVGRDDAADHLTTVESPVPSAGDSGGEEGLRAAMRRRRILDKPQKERSADEIGWLAAYEDMHPRKLDPGIYPTGERRAFEAIFDDWQAARNRMLNVTLEYAATRKIPFQVAEKELLDVHQMATDVQDGRPWTPPWNPGAEFGEGDEPWKRDWWPTKGKTSPYNLGISQIGGYDWDISRVHENRKRAAKERRVWNDYRKVTLAAEERGLRDVLRAAEYWGRDSGIDWGAFNRRLLKLLQDNVVASLDDIKAALADLVPAADAVETDDDVESSEGSTRIDIAHPSDVLAGLAPGQQGISPRVAAEELDRAVEDLLSDIRAVDSSIDFVQNYRKARAALDAIVYTPAGQLAHLTLAQQVVDDAGLKLSVSEIAANYGKFDDLHAPPTGENTGHQSEYDLAQRTAPPGYTPGRSEQGDGGGEESQSPPLPKGDSSV